MKYFLSIFLFSLYINVVSSQEKHFVFIQSDNHQPFYVTLKGKNYSSSSSGYVIIPKLNDGDYNLSIGFAKNAYPEQNFTVSINNKDLGYNLKNFEEKGWGLFNLQTLGVTMATVGSTPTDVAANPSDAAAADDDFVISFNKKKKEPVKDTTIAKVQQPQSDVPVTPPAKTLETEVIKAVDTAVIVKTDVNTNTTTDTLASNVAPKKEETAANNNTSNNVKKVSEVNNTEGVYLSYVDSAGKRTDTIQVIIPSGGTGSTDSAISPATTKNNTAAPTAAATEVKPASEVKSKAKKKSDEPKFLDLTVNAPEKDKAQPVAKPAETFTIMPNSNCKNIADEEDYAKLRKKMAEQTTDEKMINEAKKVYRNKCFTTSQIKGLSTLFLSDEGRFKFFDASFVSVADSSEYPTLQSEFIDPAYVARFKALLQ